MFHLVTLFTNHTLFSNVRLMLVELMSLIVRKVCMNSKQFIMSGLCRSYAVSSETYNFHALTEIAALCLKLCHLKDKNVT